MAVLIKQPLIFLEGHRRDLLVSHFSDATGGSTFALGDWLVAVYFRQDRLAESRLAALELFIHLELGPCVGDELEILSNPSGLPFAFAECFARYLFLYRFR